MIQRKKLIESFGGNVLKMISSICYLSFITHEFSIEVTGVYFLVISVVTILGDLKEGFILNGFIKYIVEEKDNSKVISTSLGISFVWDVINISIYMLVALWFLELQDYTGSIIIYILLSSLSRWINYIHRGNLNTMVLFRSNAIAFSGILIGIAAIHFYSLGISFCFIVSGLAHFLPCLLIKQNRNTLYKAIRHFKIDFIILKKLLYFGKYGFLLSLAGSISHQSGVFFSAELLDLSATALIGLGGRYAMLLTIPGNSISSLIYPEILKCKKDVVKLNDRVSTGAGKMYALLTPLSIVVLVSSPFAIWLFHGVDYLFVAVIIAVRTFGFAVNLPLSTCYTSVKNTLDKPYEVTRLVVINSIINLISIGPLMYLIGLWGVLLSSLIIEVVGFIIMRAGLRSEIGLSLHQIPRIVGYYWKYWLERYFNSKFILKKIHHAFES